jgi:hypothetical protein
MLANHAPAADDSPQGDSDQSHSDYDTILAALMDSARGRSFLQQYALRNRVADTATLLTAIGRIEGLLTSRGLEPSGPSDAPPPSEPVAESIVEPAVNETVIETSAAERDEIEIQRSPQAGETAMAALDGAVLQVMAIEFLGPDLGGPEPSSFAPILQDIPAKPETRDPFADICALSYEEKIALFT